MVEASGDMHLAVALDGAGWHPAAREAGRGWLVGETQPSAGLDEFAGKVVPLLQERGVFRTEYEDRTTLRDRMGLGPARPASDWAAARAAGTEKTDA